MAEFFYFFPVFFLPNESGISESITNIQVNRSLYEGFS